VALPNLTRDQAVERAALVTVDNYHVVLDLTSDGEGGSRLGFTLLAAGDPPDPALTGHIRKRINQVLFADLRFSYGQ